jgi:phospholipid/cholesterol/gamma-HCH transport system ATP-binding protein
MIRVEGLHKSFGDHEVLKGVNLDVKKGETIVILGGSGEGKSVLLKHMIGLMRPDRGKVYLTGVDTSNLSGDQMREVQKNTGLLFQHSALFDSLTVLENVGFSLFEHTDKSYDEIAAIVKHKLELVNLPGIEHMMPADLSGGMKKRVSLARAIANDPQILFYDEPTTGLDPITADSINDLIQEMQEKLNVTSVVVTHDIASAFKVGDRQAMLHNGQIIADAPTEVFRNLENKYIQCFISGKADNELIAARDIIDSQHLHYTG